MKDILKALKGKTKIEQAKYLYQYVGRRVPFFEALAAHVDRSTHTLTCHWFGRFWNIPESEIDKVLKFMLTYIEDILNPKKESA